MRGNRSDEPIVIDSDDDKPPKEAITQPPQEISPIVFLSINRGNSSVRESRTALPIKRVFPKSKNQRIEDEQPNQKKFKEAEIEYRKFQTKEGKKCRIGDTVQASLPPKREFKDDKSSMTVVWNPWIISENESKLLSAMYSK